MIVCLFCHQELGRKLAGWTGRLLAEPVVALAPQSAVTQPGWFAICPSCTAWMRDRDRYVAPVGLLRTIREHGSRLKKPEWASEYRDLAVGHARRVADALGPPLPILSALRERVAAGNEMSP